MNLLHGFLLYVSLLCGVILLPLVVLQKHESDNSELFLGKYPIPSEPRNPINIDTKKVHNAELSPFSLRAILNDKVEVANFGKIVEILLDQNSTESRVTGGPLGDDLYQFIKIKYSWTDDMDGVAATTIDGLGYILEIIGIFFNKKYITFENALKHQDGLAGVDFTIKICSTPNEKFPKYAEALKRVRKPGSRVQTTLGTAIDWYASGEYPPDSFYFAYPGSYYNASTGQFYYAVTTIILPHLEENCLSREQFEGTFGSMENSEGEPLTTEQPQYPANMPIVRAKKITNTNIE